MRTPEDDNFYSKDECPKCGMLYSKVLQRNQNSKVATSEHHDLEYAGFWMRVWATIIDSVLIAVITTTILLAIYGTQYFESEKLIEGPMDFLISWVLPAIAIITFWVYRAATPGKMAISSKIVDAQTGGQPSTGRFVGRYFAYFISALPLLLGYIWVAFDKKKQGWHDKLSGTVVVRNKNNGPGAIGFENKA